MPPYSARVSAVDLPPSIWQSLVDSRLLSSVYSAWQRSSMQNLQRMGKNTGPNLSRLLAKVHEIFRHVGDLSYFPKPLPIVYVVFSSEDTYSPYR